MQINQNSKKQSHNLYTTVSYKIFLEEIPDRPGSNKDAKDIADVFKEYGFEVDNIYQDYTSWKAGEVNNITVFNWVGVEDTRLEAKAKDTKKFWGQGQGQNLSRPRTRTQVFSKKKKKKKKSSNFFLGKKGLQNFFSGDLYLRKPKKGLCRFSERFLAFSNEISTVQK